MRPEIAEACREIFRGNEEPRPIFTIWGWRAWFQAYLYAYTPEFAEEVRRDRQFGTAPTDLIRNGHCTCCVCRVGGTHVAP